MKKVGVDWWWDRRHGPRDDKHCSDFSSRFHISQSAIQCHITSNQVWVLYNINHILQSICLSAKAPAQEILLQFHYMLAKNS